MTKVNVKVKVHVVDRLFVGPGYVTEVWISEDASAAFDKFTGQTHETGLVEKLEYYAKAGFAKHEGKKRPILHEGNGVFRIRLKGTLFRLLGVYEKGRGKRSFIIIDGFEKRGQKLSASDRERIKNVGRVKELEAWKRRNS